MGTNLSLSLGLGSRFLIGGTPTPPPVPADYVVTNDSEWSAVMANSAATLAGKIVEVSGDDFSESVITGRDMDAVGDPLVIRSADASSAVQRIRLEGVTRGIDFTGLNIQMKGWPANYPECVKYGSGTFGKLRFHEGTTFRHGYGALLEDIDTTADLTEYARVDNVQTATASSATYALSWQNAAMTSGSVYFFNRGAQTVHVAFGGSGVTASAADIACPPQEKPTIIHDRNPSTETHFAIIAASGTSEVNARSEIGLGRYLASAFGTSGTATVEDVEVRDCEFTDLANGVQGITSPTSAIVMDNDLRRIYGDIITIAPTPGGSAYILRNEYDLPFSRSGIAENLNGDAGDPHGDAFQMFSNDTSAVIGPVYYAGNVPRVGNLRTGATSQGAFVSDHDFDPSYTDVFLIASAFIGGAGSGMGIGETGYPVRDVFSYGITVVDRADNTNTTPGVAVVSDGDGTAYFGSIITPRFVEQDAAVEKDGVVLLSDVASIPAVFPNFADLASATTRAQVQAALTTAAEGAGKGFAAASDAIDWTATDPDAVIRWENLPSGADWNNLTNQSPDTQIVLPLRKIMNQRAAQAVSVGAGTEWRSYESDGTTLDTDWTSASGTIEPGQFIQMRRTTSATGGETVTASVTINGFAQAVTMQSASVPTNFLVSDGTGFFYDSTNIPSGTNRMTWRGKVWLPTTGRVNGQKLFAALSTQCDFEILTTGEVRLIVEDDTGTKMLNSVIVSGLTLPNQQWLTIEYDVNQITQEAIVTVDGAIYTVPFTATSSGAFGTYADIAFLATSSPTPPANSIMPSGTRAADLSVDLNGTLHKTISNTAATANADPWHQGGNFTDAP